MELVSSMFLSRRFFNKYTRKNFSSFTGKKLQKNKKYIEEFCKLLIDFTDAFIMQLSRGSQ